MNYIEIVGYAASVLVGISLTMSKLVRLRVINTIGSATFAIYGFLLGAYPVMFMNIFIAGINIYFLIKMYRTRDEFDILSATGNKDYLYRFYDHYVKDIKSFFPEFDDNYLKDKRAIFILRNMRPVNLVVFDEQANGITEILMDYTIPEYRDFLNGKYLLNVFKNVDSNEQRQLVVKSDLPEHIKYLKRVGFVKNDAGLYVIKV